MELFYHFTSHTAKTLQPGDLFADIYTRNAVSCALENAFLMHQILAITACHLSVLRVEERTHYCMLGTVLMTALLPSEALSVPVVMLFQSFSGRSHDDQSLLRARDPLSEYRLVPSNILTHYSHNLSSESSN